MPRYFSNIGLKEVYESDQAMNYIIGETATNGNVIVGYYGYPYVNHHFGTGQVILRTKLTDSAEKSCDVIGVDTHCSGSCVWDVMVLEDLTEYDLEDVMQKRLLVADTSDSKNMAVIEVVNADVLPSYMKGDTIKLQVVAFPHVIRYYDDFESAKTETKIENQSLSHSIELGHILPGVYLTKPAGMQSADEPDDLKSIFCRTVEICGEVKALHYGVLEIGEEKVNAFIRCTVKTNYGDLDIAHSFEAIPETEFDKIKVGAVVRTIAVISGDAAIYEYDKGIVLNQENNLRALAFAMEAGHIERLRSILNENVTYISERSNKQLTGVEEVLQHISKVYSNCRNSEKDVVFARFATISDSSSEENARPVGTMCVALAYGDKENIESVIFIDLDDERKIKNIYLSVNTEYRFKIEWPGMGKIKKPRTKVDIVIDCINQNCFDELPLELITKCTFCDLDGNEVQGREATLEQLKHLTELTHMNGCCLTASKGKHPDIEKYVVILQDKSTGNTVGMLDVSYQQNRITRCKLYPVDMIEQLKIIEIEREGE